MKSTKAKTILIFTDWYLPGYKAGGPIRSMANMVRALGDDYHFKIVCSDRDYMERAPYADIGTETWTAMEKAEVRYLNPEQQTYRFIKHLTREAQPDVVYINGLFSKVYSIFPLRAARSLNRSVIIAPRGMLAPGALGIKTRKKNLFLALSRKLGWYRKVVFHATHSHEVEHIQAALGEGSSIVDVPNIPERSKRTISRTKSKGYLNIAVVSRIAPEKNIDYALDCLSKLPGHVQVRVDFIGPVYDQLYFQKCAKLAKQLPVNVRVSWEGSRAHEEIRAYFDKAHLFFLPTLGENFGHAILEAMLSGLPVLISDQTPWRNLEAQQLGKDIPLTHADAFVQSIVEFAEMDATSYQKYYGSVAQNVLSILDTDQIISGYITLFG